MRLTPVCLLALLVGLAGAPALAQSNARVFIDRDRSIAIDPDRGRDPRVDYRALTAIGAWDDRNYGVTLEDLALLSPNESEIAGALPVFFRVEMRRRWPELQRVGRAQYPRHAHRIFREMFGGHLVNGKVYKTYERVGDRFELVLEQGKPLTEALDELESLSGESRVTTPNGAAESAVAIDPTNKEIVIAGTNGPITGQDMWYSTNGGDTWTRVSLPLGGTSGDPTVAWSSNGSFAYTATLGSCGFSGCQVWFYRSANKGVTWTSLESITPGDPRRELTTGGGDKEYMHVDRFATSPYKDNIYVTWHQGNVLRIARSNDFGNTFTTVVMPSDSSNRGIGSDVTTDKGGAVYHIWPGTNSSTIRLAKSTNGGTSYGTPTVIANTQASFDFPVPSMDRRNVFVYTAADADLTNGTYANSIYVAWTDSTAPTSGTAANNHARIQVAYSRNGGSTWTVTTPHETADALTVDRFHPWLAVGPDGTVHVIYYDTRRDATRRSVDLFYSYSTNGAQTWSAPQRVTTVLSPKINDGFEWGDYNGADIVLDSLIAIYTDNRDESGGTSQSVDVYAAGITPGAGAVCGNAVVEPGEACDGVNVGGLTCQDVVCDAGILRCLPDCSGLDKAQCGGCGAGRIPGSRGVSGEPLLIAKSGSNLALDWATSCGTASDYAIYEGQLGIAESFAAKQCTTGGATNATIAPATGSRSYLVTALRGTVEGSYGRKSDGSERTPPATACQPQEITDACP